MDAYKQDIVKSLIIHLKFDEKSTKAHIENTILKQPDFGYVHRQIMRLETEGHDIAAQMIYDALKEQRHNYLSLAWAKDGFEQYDDGDSIFMSAYSIKPEEFRELKDNKISRILQKFI